MSYSIFSSAIVRFSYGINRVDLLYSYTKQSWTPSHISFLSLVVIDGDIYSKHPTELGVFICEQIVQYPTESLRLDAC